MFFYDVNFILKIETFFHQNVVLKLLKALRFYRFLDLLQSMAAATGHKVRVGLEKCLGLENRPQGGF